MTGRINYTPEAQQQNDLDDWILGVGGAVRGCVWAAESETLKSSRSTLLPT